MGGRNDVWAPPGNYMVMVGAGNALLDGVAARAKESPID